MGGKRDRGVQKGVSNAFGSAPRWEKENLRRLDKTRAGWSSSEEKERGNCYAFDLKGDRLISEWITLRRKKKKGNVEEEKKRRTTKKNTPNARRFQEKKRKCTESLRM